MHSKFTLCFLMLVLASSASGQLVGSLEDLVDFEDTIDIRTKKKFLCDVNIVEVKLGKGDGVVSLQVMTKDAQRARRIPATQIEEIYTLGQPMDVRYDRKQRSLIIDHEQRKERLAHLQQVQERLGKMRRRLWDARTEEETAEFMEKHRKFIDKTKAAMPTVPFRLVETRFFLFLTDLPPEQVDGYIAHLDSMYEMLCAAFSISPEKNIWCGKCVVVTFLAKENYLEFENSVMDNSDAEGSQGLCHQSSDGTVIFAGFQGERSGYFGHTLVHETSHGFVHRYISSARVPSWLNEGIADWLAEAVVQQGHTKNKQKQSAKYIMSRNGWGDFLTTEKINYEHYGAAAALVEILRSMDRTGTQFKLYFDAMKEGIDPEQALQDAFEITYQDLEILYGRRIAKLGR